MIIVDTREQKPFTECDAWKDVEYIEEKLNTADYSNGNILIERKSVADFINCCGKDKKRFLKELERGFDYIIIEGSPEDIKRHLKKVNSRMSYNYIIHMLKEIRKTGTEVILCKDRELAAGISLKFLREKTDQEYEWT